MDDGSRLRAAVGSHRLDAGGPVHVAISDAPGDAPLVICVHGLGGSWANWLPLMPLLRLPGGIVPRVAAVDLPGFGLSPSAGRRCDVRDYATLTLRLIRDLGHDRALVCGNSMGALVALLAARADPAVVSGLVLLDPAQLARPRHRPNPLVSGMFGSYFLPGVGPAVVAARRWARTPRQLATETLRLVTADPGRIPADVVDAHVAVAQARQGRPEVPQDFGAAARSMGRDLLRLDPLTRAVDAAGVPVLLLHGDRDRLVPLAAARDLAARHPAWEFGVAPGSGHLPQLELPEWTADRIESWLARRPGSVPPPRVR